MSSASPTYEGLRVLVAEDERKTREFLVGLLERVGCETMVAAAGFEAVKATVNEREKSGAASLGKFKLDAGRSVTITLSNKGTDGFVVADGGQLLKVP